MEDIAFERKGVELNGLRLSEPALVDLLFGEFSSHCQELTTHAQRMEAAEKAAWFLSSIGRDGWAPDRDGVEVIGMPESAGDVAERDPDRDDADSPLHDMWARYDVIWEEMVADNERRRRDGVTESVEDDPRACEIRDRLAAVSAQIREHGQRDFEADLRDALGEQVADDKVAVAVYGSLCNVEWRHRDGSRFSCSWRYAGGLVADMRRRDECYLDFYCSGGEGDVAEQVRRALEQRGWAPVDPGVD